MGLAQICLHFSISLKSESQKMKFANFAFCLITWKRFIFMKNKEHILPIEFYKDHFKYQHDGATTNIFRYVDAEERGESHFLHSPFSTKSNKQKYLC